MRSFGDNPIHRQLFRGRDRDKYDLLQLVLCERLVVLFSRSGLGKSSLISAGLMQPLRDKGFFPIVARVTGAEGNPVESVYKCIEAAGTRAIAAGEIETVEPREAAAWNKTSFWHFFKSFYIWRDGEDQPLEPVIILDQFEELFTIVADDARKRFIGELADLVRGTRPMVESPTPDSSEQLGDQPPPVKILLSVREDFLANLEEMAERIPAILKTRFRLAPLGREDARRAIVEPAAFTSRDLDTPPFTWSEDAVRHALDFLCERISPSGKTEVGNEVEPFQLQLVCQHAENLVLEKALSTLSAGDLGGEDALRGILTHFYQDTIDKLCKRFRGFRLRRKLQNLCEEGLISGKGRRLLRDEGNIHESDHVSGEVLAAMVESRLVRKEPRGAVNYYELAHDTLIEPILASRESRERRVKRRAAGTGVALLATVAGAVTVGATFVERREAQLELASRLVEHSDTWQSLGNDRLAQAFYDQALALGGRRDETVPAVELNSYDAALVDAAIRRADGVLNQIREVTLKVAGVGLLSDETNEQIRDLLNGRPGEATQLADVAGRLAARGETPGAVRLFEKAGELDRRYRDLPRLEAVVPGQKGAGQRGGAPRGGVQRGFAPKSADPSGTEPDETGERTSDVVRTALLSVANLLARAGYSDEAAALYTTIQTEKPGAVPAASWNYLCWYGGLSTPNPSPVVASGCDEALRVDEVAVRSGAAGWSGGFRDSRGIVRARLGDFQGAINDFEAYLEWAPANYQDAEVSDRRRRWIAELREGRNPFDDTRALEDLLNEGSDDILNARDELRQMSLPAEFVAASLTDLLVSWSQSRSLLRQVAANPPLCNVASENPDTFMRLLDQCDDDWANDRLPGMTELQANDCSAALKSMRRVFPSLVEIFVADAVGLNACLSDKTSDYYQGDEDWWRLAKDGMPGFEYDFDWSASQYSALVSVPVRDRGGSVLGAMKASFDVVVLAHRAEGKRAVAAPLPDA